ncbi:MAG: fructosamine kinase [Flavobacteriaceae bacterium]|nr:fructosamine kinase [Flavobacteriaceae bacterium]
MQATLKEIAEKNSLKLKEFKPLSGGDINTVYALYCQQGNFVIKLNNASRFPKMFETEAKGLQLLAASHTFKIPEVLAYGATKGTSYILLEKIEKGVKTKHFWSIFAENLAKMHKITQKYFGLPYPNYIASLPQPNSCEATSTDFYINQRLQPQFNLAAKNGFAFKDLDSFFNKVSELIPQEAPSLIHGDLWNGNYLISANGTPVLIDPTVSFAPREMDLAMMQLFGGFPQEVFSVYNEVFPLEDSWKARIPLFQLYYLLVHLNIFGSGYLPQVQRILQAFS